MRGKPGAAALAAARTRRIMLREAVAAKAFQDRGCRTAHGAGHFRNRATLGEAIAPSKPTVSGRNVEAVVAEGQGAQSSTDVGGRRIRRLAEGLQRRLMRHDELDHPGKEARFSGCLANLRSLDAADGEEAR